MRTLLNLIQAIDKNQILLSSDLLRNKSAPMRMARHEIWKQVVEAFNEVTGKQATQFILSGIFKRMRGVWLGKYLDYDEDLGKWIVIQ